jgi:hypothetical protein
MKELELSHSWKDFGKKLQDEMHLDMFTQEGKRVNKIKKLLNWLLVRRLLEALVFGLFSYWLIRFTINYHSVVHYLLAGIILGVFSVTGFIGNLRVAFTILNLDYSSPVASFQEKLERIKVYNLQILRLLFLSIPFYLAYIIIGSEVIIGLDFLGHADTTWLWMNLAISALFLWPAIWLYRNLSYKTKIRWIKGMIMDNGGKQIRFAFQFLNEIEHFKANDAGQ